jgi:hypothetical protein
LPCGKNWLQRRASTKIRGRSGDAVSFAEWAKFKVFFSDYAIRFASARFRLHDQCIDRKDALAGADQRIDFHFGDRFAGIGREF